MGLGSDFNWPYSLVLDEKGIYYDPSRPSGLEDILNTLPKHPERAELCSRASTLRGFIVEKGITKYNTGVDAVTRGDFSAKGRLLLVPGQVEDDASVRLEDAGCFPMWICSRPCENAIRMLSSSISRILTWKAGTGKGAYPMERRYGTRIVLSATCVWMSCLASSTKCTRSRRLRDSRHC